MSTKQDEHNQQLKSGIKDVMQTKQLLLEACENVDQEFVNITKQAEKKNDMWLVIKGNGLNTKSEEKRKKVERQSTFWERNKKSYSEQ